MPFGEFRSWARLKLAKVIGNEDFLDDAGRRADEYHTGILRNGENFYGVK